MHIIGFLKGVIYFFCLASTVPVEKSPPEEGTDVVDQRLQPSSLATVGVDSDANNMPADSELSAILSRRCDINEGLEEGRDLRVKSKVFNVYTEFAEYSVKQIKSFLQTFKK
jgi:hypothetical protein